MSDRIKITKKGHMLIYKKVIKRTKKLFGGKNQPAVEKEKIVKYVLLNIGHGTFKAVPYTTYKKLLTIKTFYTNSKLYSYDDVGDDMVVENRWKHILHSPEEIVKFYDDMRHISYVYYNQIPAIWWDCIFEIKHKKIKFKTKDGKKHKMSMDNFVYQYLRGIQL